MNANADDASLVAAGINCGNDWTSVGIAAGLIAGGLPGASVHAEHQLRTGDRLVGRVPPASSELPQMPEPRNESTSDMHISAPKGGSCSEVTGGYRPLARNSAISIRCHGRSPLSRSDGLCAVIHPVAVSSTPISHPHGAVTDPSDETYIHAEVWMERPIMKNFCGIQSHRRYNTTHQMSISRQTQRAICPQKMGRGIDSVHE